MAQRIITVAVLVVALVALWRYWPSDERRIQRLVQEMAAALQPEAGETDLARAGRLAPLARGLSSDVLVEGPAPLHGRELVMGAAMQAGRVAPGLAIVVRDVEVNVEPARAMATARVTIAITGMDPAAGAAWHDVTELHLDLTRQNDVWIVIRVAPVAPLRP